MKAKRRNDEDIARALGFLKTSGVPEKDVQTDYISIEPYGPNGAYWSSISSNETPTGYAVRKSIEVKLTKMDAFDGVLTGLLTNGVNSVQGIDFHTSHLREHRDKARSLAIRAAREKADALAAELGVKVGQVYNINASESGGWWNFGGSYWGGRYGGGMAQNVVQNAGGPSESGDGTLSIGQITVSASVNVSFLIEK